ncbi:hypothetical protein Taro_046598, partial [Colocasia esculenta]|nr:hypothetical protein [Colocasia esculenta]
CTASKKGTREMKGMDSKQQKKQRSSKEDTMQSFYVSYFPQYTREKKLREIKERCKNSEEQKKLDTNAFESLEYLWSKLSDVKRKTCTYLDCLWFSLYMDGPSQSKVLTWIKKKHIFSRKCVFVQIICWGETLEPSHLVSFWGKLSVKNQKTLLAVARFSWKY